MNFKCNKTSLKRTIVGRVLLFILTLVLIIFPKNVDKVSADSSTAIADSTPCSNFRTNGGYFFDDYETHDYVNGFLELHLRLKQPYNDGRAWTRTAFYLYDSSCNQTYQETSFQPHVAVDGGMQLYSIRFTSSTHYDIWNDESNTKQTCAACSADISAEPSASVAFYAAIDGNSSFVISDSFPVVQPTPSKDPVLIIPGILGTELSYNDKVEWPDLAMMALSDDAFMDNLMMDESGQPTSNITVGKVIQKLNYAFGTFHYTDGIITALEKQGYELDKNIFIFPYDWRLDPKDIEPLLKTEIDKILNDNPQNKIDIIAHSYGGLILKNYIKSTSDPRIDKVVFVGVPHLGAPEAAHALIFGNDLGIPILNEKEIYKLSQNMPMIYDLLPSQNYYKKNAGFFDDFTDLKNPTIASYDSSKNMMIDLGKNLRLLNQSEISHTDDLDNMDFSKFQYHVYNITGCGVFTLKTINKMYSAEPTLIYRATHGPKYRIEGDSGDGVVTVGSSQLAGVNQFYISGIEHSQLLANDKSANAISEIILGVTPSGLSTIDDSSCSISGKLLSFSSSVDVSIKDHSTGNTLKPRQDYDIINTAGDQNIFIPADKISTYEVQIKEEDLSSGSTSTPENISIKNINTQNKPSTTYNYNDINIGTAKLDLNFPNDLSGGQTLTSVDNSGNNNNVPASEELDSGYNQVSGTQTQTSTDTSNQSVITNPQTETTTNSTSSNETQGQSANNQDSSANTVSADSGEDEDNGNPSLSSGSESTDTTTNPVTEEHIAADKPQNININLNFPKNASDAEAAINKPKEDTDSIHPEIIQTVNMDSGDTDLIHILCALSLLIIKHIF